jgi:hypothetical protein
MARITNMPKFMMRPVWIWDLDQSVGWGRTNLRDDVLLIQVMLNRVMRQLGLTDGRKRTPRPTGGWESGDLAFLKTDSKFGPETHYAIQTYQRRGGTVDGAADEVHPLLQKLDADTNVQIMTTQKIYGRMIYRLNKDHLAIYNRMLDEKDFPPSSAIHRHHRPPSPPDPFRP